MCILEWFFFLADHLYIRPTAIAIAFLSLYWLPSLFSVSTFLSFLSVKCSVYFCNKNSIPFHGLQSLWVYSLHLDVKSKS